MAQVILDNLTKTFTDKSSGVVDAVKRIHLSIADGEFMVLVGPSGCGKSTTLRMIAGLEEASAGTILIGDRDVTNVLPKDRDIAMVFQNYALYPHMSVYENMAFGLKLRRLPTAEIETRVNSAAQRLGLDEYLKRLPKALSGGQRQRVALGRAIVRQPQVFLFDEPLSNLDAKMRVSMRAEISRLHRQLKATMIYVTHDQVEAMTMGDRICVMKDGEIMQVATPLELYRQPANLFVAGFIGSPPMNFFRGHSTAKAGLTVFQADRDAGGFSTMVPHLTKAPPGELSMGVRPEDLREAVPGSPNPVRMTVEMLEPTGAETHVHLLCGSTPCIARVSPDRELRIGESITVDWDPSKSLLFDSGTGVRIR